MQTLITARQYYEVNPPQSHHTGDLWAGLPTHGLLPMTTAPGLVITPACDLAQGKVETITYLPVVTIPEWFCTRSYEGDAVSAIRNEARMLEVSSPLFDVTFGQLDVLEVARFRNDVAAVGVTDARRKEARQRCLAGATLLDGLLRPGPPDPKAALSAAKELYGPKQWMQLLRQLITNYRRDLQFLPADGMPAEWSVVRGHSLVLFRYPLTAPVAIFDAAQEVSLPNWKTWTQQYAAHCPLAAAFTSFRPLKGLCLKKDFLADLLTRYTALYMRIGSPDFTATTIDDYLAELEP